MLKVFSSQVRIYMYFLHYHSARPNAHRPPAFWLDSHTRPLILCSPTEKYVAVRCSVSHAYYSGGFRVIQRIPVPLAFGGGKCCGGRWGVGLSWFTFVVDTTLHLATGIFVIITSLRRANTAVADIAALWALEITLSVEQYVWISVYPRIVSR